jgi:hypothetical protein
MRSPAVIEIGEDSFEDVAPERHLLLLVLLVDIKDGATEARIECAGPRAPWRLRCKLDGDFYDMVPAPAGVPLGRELRRLAGLGLFRRPLDHLWAALGWAAGGPYMLAGRVRVVVAGKPVDFDVTLRHGGAWGWHTLRSITWSHPPCPELAEDARRLLRAGMDSIGELPE